MFSSRFMLFPTFRKQIWWGVDCFFLETLLSHFISGFMLFSTLNFVCGNIEKCPFTYWFNTRWFLQIVDRDSGNLYPIYPLFPYSDLLSQMWGGGGGVMLFLHFMLFPNKK